jgi:hypothetical protein
LTAATTYYAQARNNTTGCVSTTRLAVTGTVNPVPTITRVSGAASQSLNWYTAITPIVYRTTTNSAIISRTGGTFTTGVTGAPSGTPTGTSYTISGTPSATGTFGYSLTASVNGCTSAAYAGTITVDAGFYSPSTWSIGNVTWSDRVVMRPAGCTLVDKTSRISTLLAPAEYATLSYQGITHYYYNWNCAINLCKSPWRLPTSSEGQDLIDSTTPSVLGSMWGIPGADADPARVGQDAWLWTRSYIQDQTAAGLMAIRYVGIVPNVSPQNIGWAFEVRCVK